MRKLYFLSGLLFFSINQATFGQCPPPGFPEPGNSCVTAPILCEDLDGYCATINNTASVQTFPGCPGWQLNNDEWFAFFAGSTSISIQITPSDCSPGGQQGLQGGIYQACGPPWVSMDLQCSCTENPFILNSNNFVIGQVYYIVLDGCGGNVCDYSVDVLVGSTVSVPPGMAGPISGPLVACPGNAAYNIAAVSAAASYVWTITPPIGTTGSTTNNATINWSNPATTTSVNVCVEPENLCFNMNPPSCTTVVVIPTPTAMLSGSGILCAGAMGMVPLTVNFTGEPPWLLNYTVGGVAQPPITTSTTPYTLNVTSPGLVQLTSVSSTTGNCNGTVSGTVTINEVTLNGTVTPTAATCGQSNGSLDLAPGGGQVPYTYIWSNGATSQDLSNIPPGPYTVTVTSNNGCTQVITATVPDNPIPLTVTGVLTANTTCINGNGAIDVSVAPAGTYTYVWSNGETIQDLTNVPAGAYTVTVTGGVNCTATATFNVNDEPNNPNPTITTVGTTCDDANGSANLSVTGGVSPYTYLWSNGETTEDLANVLAGAYTVTVTGANGCTASATATIVNTNPPITITGTTMPNTTCNGSNNGSVSITIAPAAPPGGGAYTITWSPSGSGTNLTNLAPGTYSVTVSAGGSCSQTAAFTVADQPNAPTASIAPTQSTCDQSNGGATLSVSGGVAPYTFMWSNGETTQNLTNILAGPYSVTVTGANGCTVVASTSVTNNNPPITITPNILPNTTCDGNNNGSISITISPAAPPGGGTYNIVWSPSGTGTSLTNLAPGSYSVTVSAGGACSQTGTFTVPDQPNAPTANITPLQSTCDQSNGSVGLLVSGGVTPYTFMWSNGATTQNLANIPAGPYSVTVTGANGCTVAASTSVTNNNPPITITPNVFPNTTCNGLNNGSISITIAPPGAYTYMWSPSGAGTNLTNLAPGTYTVTVSASGSCSQTGSFTVPNQPNLPVVTPNPIASTCGLPNGSATLNVSGSTQPYTYNWSNGSTNPSITNVLAGSYSVTVTGANGCTAATSVIIPNDNPPMTITSNITPNTSCALGNGAIDVFVVPGGTLSYIWSNGNATPNPSGLAPGTYTVTVSAGGTCTQAASFTVPDNSQNPIVDVSTIASTCGGSNGSATITLSGGEPPFAFNWSNGSVNQNLNDVLAGGYTVSITSAVGCTAVAAVNIPNNNIAFDVMANVIGNSSCATPNGSIQLNVTPPGAYTYQWSTGETSTFLLQLSGGQYTVTVGAGGSCEQVFTYDVFEFAFPPQVTSATTAATCGAANGATNITVTGGETPYSYLWSNGATTEDLTNVAPGPYSVTVSGANGCTATASMNIVNNNVALNATGTPTANTSCIAPNGALNLTVTPAGTYTYIWSNMATTEDLANLAAGSYTVTVSAGAACTTTASFTIQNNTSTPVIAENITSAVCGGSNGAIDLSITGATTPYTFIWSNAATTEDLSNVPGGAYSVTVTGANGCSATATLDVPDNSSDFTLSAVETPLTSCSSNNGAINLTVTPAGSYTFVWSNAATSEDLTNLAPGTYSVTVNQTGVACPASLSFVIEDQTTSPDLAQSITAETCGLLDGGIDITVSGGTAPYNYLWSNTETTQDLTAIAAGTYDVTVTDVNGCTDAGTYNVPDNSIPLTVSGTPTSNTSCAVLNGGIDVTASPAGTYTYMWSNLETTEDLTGISGGAYSVTVSAGGNCTAEANFTVASTTADPVVSQTLSPSICGEDNGGINLTVTGGVTPYTFVWSNSETTEDLANIPAGPYSVTVTGGNGCAVNAAFTLTNNNPVFSVNGTPSANTSCDAPNGGLNITVTPAGTYSYEWSNMETTEDLSDLTPGTYIVTVTQGQTCTATGSFMVGNNTNAPNFTNNIVAALCGNDAGGIDLTASGGTSPYTFLWSNAEVTEDLTNIPGGDYSVTVTGADGCANSENFTVPDDVINLALSGTPTANTACTDGNGSVDLTVSPAGTYTYIWSNSETTEDLADITAGTYDVTVSAGGTCTEEASIMVVNTPDLPSISQVVTPSICSAPDGGINLTVTGGAAPLTFLWSNDETTEDLTAINAGSYEVTVTTATGCTATGAYNVANVSNTFTFSGTTAPNTLCGSSNGGINLTVTPAGAYTFEWSNMATTEDLTGLAPGDYAVTVSDGGSCTATEVFTVGNNSPAPNVVGTTNDILCFGQTSGVNLTVTGGLMPYTFDWSPTIAGNPEDPTGLSGGTYDVTVSDASGCSTTASFSIDAPTSELAISCSQTATVSTPGATDGSGGVDISGGTGPYQVTWSPGSTQSNVAAGLFSIDNLAEANYEVTVTDANGCTATCTFNISAIPCETKLGTMSSSLIPLCGSGCITATYDNIGQFLDPDDALQFILHTGSGATIVNEIERSNTPTFCFDAATMNYGQTYYISAVAGNDDGFGNVVLTDPCKKVTAGTPIVFNQPPVATVNQPAPLTCTVQQVALNGTSTGTNPTFQWTASNGGVIVGSPTAANIQASEAGTYTLIVNAAGCADTTVVNVADISTQIVTSISAAPSDALDCNVSEVTLLGSANGQTGLSYAWFVNGNLVSTNLNYSTDQAGTFVFVAFDPLSNCADTVSTTITDNSDFPPLFTTTPQALNCKDTETTLTGGSQVPGVEFYWATIVGTDTTVIGFGDNVFVTDPGTYYLVGTAPNGCINAAEVLVSGDFTPPSANAGQNQSLDCVQSPLDLTGSGSAGTTLFWTVNNPAVVLSNPTSPTITVDETGTYTLTVTNLGNFCTDTDDVEVFQYENVPQGIITTQDPDCFGDIDGVISIENDPANGPYSYQLNGQNYGGNSVIAPLAPGNYQVQVTDGQGCVWTTSVQIDEPIELTVDLGADLVVNLGEEITLQAQYTVDATQLDTIIWSPSALFPCLEMPCDIQTILPLQQTAVGVTVIDTNGCRADDIMTFFVQKSRSVYVPNAFSPNGDGVNDVIMVFGSKEVLNIKKFLVFSRWGETVYQYHNFLPNDPAYGWDGNHRGQAMNPAVFAWFAEVEFVDGSVELFEGDVTLMR